MPEATKSKDSWDRLTALSVILIPAAIALAGHFISAGIESAEIKNAEANTRIAQASLINTMIKSLTSDDPQERKLAVAAVIIALPEQGPGLLQTVAQFDEDASVQAAAMATLNQRASGLIRELFADDARIRIGAAQDLILGWKNDPDVVSELVEFATKNTDNANGIYNAVVVLNEFSLSALKDHERGIRDFTKLAKEKGPKTKAKARVLEERFEELTSE